MHPSAKTLYWAARKQGTSKPVIAFDFDDVIIPYTAGFLKWHNSTYGTNWDVTQVTSHSKLPSLLGVDTAEFDLRRTRYHAVGARKRQKPIEGFLEAAERLSPYFDFALISAGNSEHFVLQYIKNNHLNRAVKFRHIICGAKDKGQACLEVGAVGLIDDRPSFLQKAAPVRNFSKLMSHLRSMSNYLSCSTSKGNTGGAVGEWLGVDEVYQQFDSAWLRLAAGYLWRLRRSLESVNRIHDNLSTTLNSST